MSATKVETVTIDKGLAEAALRAAAKAGFVDVVKGLIEAGVDPDALSGAALVLAERYADEETIDYLRTKTRIPSERFGRPLPEPNYG